MVARAREKLGSVPSPGKQFPPVIHGHNHSFFHAFVHSFSSQFVIDSFTQSLVHSDTHLLIHSFIYPVNTY